MHNVVKKLPYRKGLRVMPTLTLGGGSIADAPIRSAVLLAPVAVALMFFPFAAVAAPWDLREGARGHPDYQGASPKKSDIIFSSRSKRDDAPGLVKEFGANRVEWVYAADKAWIDELRKAAPWFGGTVNSTLKLPNDSGLARDLDGQPITPPWMKSWGAKNVTTTSEITRNFLKAEATRYIKLGASSIQVDDPLLQAATVEWGGDFSDSTVAEFGPYLKSFLSPSDLAKLRIVDVDRFDYRVYLTNVHGVATAAQYRSKFKSLPTSALWLQFLRKTVADHFIDIRRHMDSVSGKRFPLSMNLGILNRPDSTNKQYFLSAFTDYAISETPIGDLNEVTVRSATLRALGIGFVPTIKVKSREENRTAIATMYALGNPTVVPWDVYINNGPNQAPGRYFGTVGEYGDLYAFVKRNPTLFDGLESTAVVGVVIPVDRYDENATMQLTRRLTASQVPYAFVLVGSATSPALDVPRANHFKALVTVNPPSDFTNDANRLLQSLNPPRYEAAKLSEAPFRNWAPVQVQGGIGSVNVFPRASASVAGKRLVVHLVDESRASNSLVVDAGCKRRVAVRADYLPGTRITKATWHSPDTDVTVPVTTTATEAAVLVPQCVLWGVLDLELSE